MGRANILYSLLNKGIVTDRWVQWAKNITRQSKYRVGSWETSLLAIYTMLVNSGRVPFEEFFKSLIDKKDPARRFARNVIANVRQDYILPIISKVMKDERPNFEKSDLLKRIWWTEEV